MYEPFLGNWENSVPDDSDQCRITQWKRGKRHCNQWWQQHSFFFSKAWKLVRAEWVKTISFLQKNLPEPAGDFRLGFTFHLQIKAFLCAWKLIFTVILHPVWLSLTFLKVYRSHVLNSSSGGQIWPSKVIYEGPLNSREPYR